MHRILLHVYTSTFHMKGSNLEFTFQLANVKTSSELNLNTCRWRLTFRYCTSLVEHAEISAFCF